MVDKRLDSTFSIYRFKPEDLPFCIEVTDEVAEELTTVQAFDFLTDEFRSSQRFRQILKTHARIVNYAKGDIIIRKGDWGNTAYFIVHGQVAVEMEPNGSSLPAEILGRREVRRRSLWKVISQLWTNHRTPEFRSREAYRTYAKNRRTASRGEGQETRIYFPDVDRVLERYKTKILGEGELFGEMSALGRIARSTTIFATGDVQLLEIRWQGLRDLRRATKEFQEEIDRRFRERALESFLTASELFAHLRDDHDTMQEIVAAVELKEYGRYDRVSRFVDLAHQGAETGLKNEPMIEEEGHYPNGVVIIRNGLARLSCRHHHGHRTVSYLTTGQVFGFDEVVQGWQSDQPAAFRHSLRAIGYLMAILVPTAVVEKHVLQHPRSRWSQSASKTASKQSQPIESVQVDKQHQLDDSFLEFIVQKRFVNGTATMLIDLDRCTRCDDCVRACASTHNNNPRFLRHGPIHNQIMVANACMHCHDPVCMIECPTGAIGRQTLEGEVTINDITCIGCGTCANNCPFDAIRMVEARDANGQFIRDKLTFEPIPKATKCDLCVDQWGGPACQRACPHDALVRIDMSNIDSLNKWSQR